LEFLSQTGCARNLRPRRASFKSGAQRLIGSGGMPGGRSGSAGTGGSGRGSAGLRGTSGGLGGGIWSGDPPTPTIKQEAMGFSQHDWRHENETQALQFQSAPSWCHCPT